MKGTRPVQRTEQAGGVEDSGPLSMTSTAVRPGATVRFGLDGTDHDGLTRFADLPG